MLIKRRALLQAAGAWVLSPRRLTPYEAGIELAVLEGRTGGRIGLAAINLATGDHLAHRAGERFAMASTFKWLLVACILSRVDRGALRLDQTIAYTKADLLPHAPVTSLHASAGALSVRALAEAAMVFSDNTAANLLLRACGGPAGVTRYMRGIGDGVTRIDRSEMALNSNLPGDPRDTTTPGAMIALMQTILTGDALGGRSKERLLGWMKSCSTGGSRLRAGFPAAWIAGDKTGTGERGAVNDVAIAWPQGATKPILVASYMDGSSASIRILEGAQAKIGSIVAGALSPA